MTEAPLTMYRVAELRAMSDAVVAALLREVDHILPTAEFHHIGATARRDGWTKGDVDVCLRVSGNEFVHTVAMLSSHYAVAQPENWTPTFASFSVRSLLLPAGIQAVVRDSEDDFLVRFHELLENAPELARRYDECKLHAAAGGSAAYWNAKDTFIRAALQPNLEAGEQANSHR